MDAGNFKAKYRSLWLAQLQLEYDEICLNYRILMQPPVFEITAGSRQLGSWRRDSRCIAVSRELIELQSWNVVLQVLKHEMAHQYCDEVEGSTSAAVHGEIFQRACERLGVLPEYRNPAVVTEDMLEAIKLQGDDKSRSARVFAKVEKLLALGGSSHIHEAELALEKARQLIEKYQLEALAGKVAGAYQVLVINTHKKQIATYRRYICRILKDFFGVRVVLSSTYDAKADTSYKTIELLGTSENVRVGEYCYYFLENQLECLWKVHRSRSKASGRTSKNSFYIGVVLGFYKKLEAGNSTADATAGVKNKGYGELLVMEEQRLDRFLHMHFPRLRKTSSRRTAIDSRSYNEGIEAGRAMNFTKGLKNGPVSGGNLLT